MQIHIFSFLIYSGKNFSKICMEPSCGLASQNYGLQLSGRLSTKEDLTHLNKSTRGETTFLYQRQSVFVSFPVTKPMVTHRVLLGWHQMIDMDIIFSMIPLPFL